MQTNNLKIEIEEDVIMERMARIGRKQDFRNESAKQMDQKEDTLLKIERKAENGVETISIILASNKFEDLSSEVRLDFDEYLRVINQLIDEEEDDWDALRMKDQINITRDAILQATILKAARTRYGVDTEARNGISLDFIKEYDAEKKYVGETTVVSLTRVASLG